MAHEVIMPALGMAQETGKIVSWQKQAGDAVKIGDVLMEVETDKAVMDVEALADGYLGSVS
ncbi:biotin/lipoyl-containing protein, partial [Falsihalocynthiibacter sp. S25ZX9]